MHNVFKSKKKKKRFIIIWQENNCQLIVNWITLLLFIHAQWNIYIVIMNTAWNQSASLTQINSGTEYNTHMIRS